MRKYVMVLIGLLSALLIAGCGGSKSSSTTISGITQLTITTDISGKTFYLININGTTTIEFKSDNTFASTFTGNTSTIPSSGTWQITGGNIVLTSGTTTQTFSCIQQEPSTASTNGTASTSATYWLVFNTSTNVISRMYTAASSYDPTQMGGSVQGTTLTSTSAPTSWVTSGTYNFNQPMGITYDKAHGCYYVADTANHIIQQISSSGTVTLIAGHPGVSGNADSSTGGLGTAAYFNSPYGVTTDGENLYVADTGNHTIRKIDLTSNHTVTTIAGVASSSGSADSNTGTSAYFSSPYGITTDGTNLYVADTGNYTIRKIVISTGAVSTIAGSAGNSGLNTEGVYTNARFYSPTRLTTDGSNLYVVDYNTNGNSAIRKVVIASGAVSTLAGGYTTRTFGHLGGITTDGTNLYLTDGDNSITNTYIRAVDKSSGSVISAFSQDITLSAGIIPPRGLTTNGTHLYFTNNKDNYIWVY